MNFLFDAEERTTPRKPNLKALKAPAKCDAAPAHEVDVFKSIM
jgi:hypothetical protein